MRAEITTSLDGFVAGPNQTLDEPLGEGGERLHEWIVKLASWRELHGLEGGEVNPDDDEIIRENARATGAYVMGRRMFSGGEGPWEEDPNANGWWGENPPFGGPVYVLTHHPRETVVKEGGTEFTFVTGIEPAIAQARAAAGDKDVTVAGGAMAIQEALRAGLLDELQIHLVPLLLGVGVRLFDHGEPLELEPASVIASPAVTHLTYRVKK